MRIVQYGSPKGTDLAETQTMPPIKTIAAAANEADRSNESRWTFFTNHTHVLVLLYEDPTLVLREVAQRVGITERAVQRIVHELEGAGFLKKERVGRQNRYTINVGKSLRHPIESHCTIESLLSLISNSRTSQ